VLSQYSWLDYFAISKDVLRDTNIDILHILDLEPNHSDHLPIVISLTDLQCKSAFSCGSVPKPEINENKSKQVKQLRWDHADVLSYYASCYEKLYAIDDQIDSAYNALHSDCDLAVSDDNKSNLVAAIELCYSQIVNILSETAKTFIPSVSKNFFKFWWDQELDSLKQLAISSHREWVQQGRPKQGIVFQNRNKHKLAYKNRIREKRKVGENAFSNDLHNALMNKDQGSFWKIWKSKFSKKSSNIPDRVDGSTSQEEIADKFASFLPKPANPTILIETWSLDKNTGRH
jgi:hypothetical protein